jgi:uncharacterized protein
VAASVPEAPARESPPAIRRHTKAASLAVKRRHPGRSKPVPPRRKRRRRPANATPNTTPTPEKAGNNEVQTGLGKSRREDLRPGPRPREEAFAAITEFAGREKLHGASLTALGAFERAVVGWFDIGAKKYRNIPVDQQCELLSAIGDIAEGDDGNASLHLHVVLGLSDGSTKGGHLLNATVRPTMEVTVVETPVHPRRKKRPDLGIALITLP